MTASSQLIESLLYQSEGTALDFKRDQYPFLNGATDDQKSELLKDILAFANSFRQADAYIIIGVKESNGNREVFHIEDDDHFDDAKLQQFINGKTNRPVEIAYEVHHYEGKDLGVIRIAKQERPIYSKKNYGNKVKQDVVYYRLGSSTAIANPDDIAKMGRDNIQSVSPPNIKLQFADLENHQELGTEINLHSRVFAKSFYLPDFQLENKSRLTSLYESALERVNPDYWREKEEYIRINDLCNSVGLVVYNQSSVLAETVRVEIKVDSSNEIYITDKLPSKPIQKGMTLNYSLNPRSIMSINNYVNHWVIAIEFGSIQPKSSKWLEKPFYIGSENLEHLELDALIFANNLAEPQKVKLTIDFTIENEESLSIEDLEKYY
jgi:Putative DNA-binding domain